MQQHDTTCDSHNILLIGIEFVEPIFSGNGILTRSIVQGLLDLGYIVSVICAQPSNEGTPDSHSTPCSIASAGNQRQLRIFPVPVPSQMWKRLDRFSAWKEMAESAPNKLSNHFPDETTELFEKVDYVVCIDWSAVPTYEALLQKFTQLARARLVQYVFRVFSMSHELFVSNDDLEFYQRHELRAMQQADIVLVISHVDKRALQQLVIDNNSKELNQSTTVDGIDMHVVVPPLRNDLLELLRNKIQNPLFATPNAKRRKYIMCNVRLSREKNAVFFAQLMRLLSDQDIFRRYNLLPLLVGAVCDEDYASTVRMLVPPETILITEFMRLSDMITYMEESVIVIHPTSYDAYGMIIAEAASVGTPSLIHFENIGVSSLFCKEKEEILTSDMRCLDTASQSLLTILRDREDGLEYLSRIGTNARKRALTWTTLDCARCIDEKLKALDSIGPKKLGASNSLKECCLKSEENK